MSKLEITRGDEVRVQGERFRVFLEDGDAEVFGSRMEKGKWYEFVDERFPIYSYGGCLLTLEGQASTEISKGSNMSAYLKLVDSIRQASTASGKGLRVLIAGPCDAGKSSLSKVLTNYRLADGSKVIYVDLDPGQSLSLPGTISAVAIHHPLPLVNSFDNLVPFSFFTGNTSPAGSPQQFLGQMRNLSVAIDAVVAANEDFLRGGMVVNSCGWIEEFGLQVLKSSIQDFHINFIVVMGSDSLYAHLLSEFPHIRTEYVPISTGIIPRSKIVRYQNRMKKIRDYFFGVSLKLTPHTQTYDFSQFVFLRCNPGMQYTTLHVHEIPTLQGHLLAISNSPSIESVSQWNVAGFVIVREVSERTQQITFLSPNSRPFPSVFLLVGTIIANGF